jgi:hypothetical protein
MPEFKAQTGDRVLVRLRVDLGLSASAVCWWIAQSEVDVGRGENWWEHCHLPLRMEREILKNHSAPAAPLSFQKLSARMATPALFNGWMKARVIVHIT